MSALLLTPLALSAGDIPGIDPQTQVRVFQVKHIDVRYLMDVMKEILEPKRIAAPASQRSRPRHDAELSYLA